VVELEPFDTVFGDEIATFLAWGDINTLAAPDD
jgi:hypothetical protein